VERAYQLARSGQFSTARQIRTQLSREGFMDASSQITGAVLVRDLGRCCRDAQASRMSFSMANAG
jgi:hypothetical protein